MHTTRERVRIVVDSVLRDRFFSKTIKAENGCLIWIGAVSHTGYGKFRLADGPQDSHVVAWRISNDGLSVPSGLVIQHQCECRLCVNPDHLVCGTQSDNMKYASRNDRRFDFVRRGEDCPNAVLTEAIVTEIRRDYVPFKVTNKMLADRYGVSVDVVKSVTRGKSWKHIPQGAAR